MSRVQTAMVAMSSGELVCRAGTFPSADREDSQALGIMGTSSTPQYYKADMYRGFRELL